MTATTVRQWLWSRARLAMAVFILAGVAVFVGIELMHDAGIRDVVAIPVALVGFALAYAPVQARVACPACKFAYWSTTGLSWRFGAPLASTTRCPECALAMDGLLPPP